MEEKYINFLKKYDLYREDIFEYMKDKTKYIDYRLDESKRFYGVFTNIENGIIKDIRVMVPYLVDDTSISIRIHEYIHVLKIYDYLNKEYVFTDYEDLLPVFYELVYAKENNNYDYINERIDELKDNFNYLKVVLDLFDQNKENNNKKLIKNKKRK